MRYSPSTTAKLWGTTSETYPFLLPALWHGRPAGHRLCSSIANGIPLVDRPMSSLLFQRGLPAHGRLRCHGRCLTVVALESYLATRGAGHSHSHHYGQFWDEDDDTTPIVHKDNFPANGNTDGLAARREGSHRPSDIAFHDTEATDGLMAGASPLQTGAQCGRQHQVPASSSTGQKKTKMIRILTWICTSLMPCQ